MRPIKKCRAMRSKATLGPKPGPTNAPWTHHTGGCPLPDLEGRRRLFEQRARTSLARTQPLDSKERKLNLNFEADASNAIEGGEAA